VDISELKNWVESGLEVGTSTSEHLSVTGEPYVVLASGGIKAEGMPHPQWYASPDEAIEAFMKAFSSYKDSVPGGKLYWRNPPKLKGSSGRFTVSSRLLISND
jgi:hypothetical protein